MNSLQAYPSQKNPATLDEARDVIHALTQKLTKEQQRRDHAEKNECCFRELAEHIPEVFWMTNPAGDQLIYISPAYEQIWGQSCNNLYEDPGQRLAWVHEADREHVLKAFKRDAQRGAYDETYRINRPDGEIRWIRDRAFAVRDDSGEIYRLAGFALDVTDHVEAQDHLHCLHATLDARERMSAFAALGTGLAHDVSQPLTAARTFVANARYCASDQPDAVDDALRRADEEIERAVDTLRHLRDFAREGKPALATQPIASMLDDVHQLMDPALRSRHIQYHGPHPDTIAHIELPMDRVLSQQVLRNLIMNAIDAVDDAPGHERIVEVSVHECDEHVDIEIADNGCGVESGIDPFESFKTTKAHGLGLGLAVGRSLTRSQGGDLILASRGGMDGSGRQAYTRLVLRLPRGQNRDQRPAHAERGSPSAAGASDA